MKAKVNRLHKGDTLLLPNTYALEADVVESIDMFVKNGGTVIADGMVRHEGPLRRNGA